MRNDRIRAALVASAMVLPGALGGCAPEIEGRPSVGSQSYAEPADELHSARISGYAWDRPEEPPAKPTEHAP